MSIEFTDEQVEKIHDQLVDLVEYLELKRARFDHIHEVSSNPGHRAMPGDVAVPKNESEVHEFIAARTQLWRRSWPLPIARKLLYEFGGLEPDDSWCTVARDSPRKQREERERREEELSQMKDRALAMGYKLVKL